MRDDPLQQAPLRYRVLRTQGRSQSEYVYTADEAQALADLWYAEDKIPVMVCEAPEGGIVRHIYTVGAAKPKRR